MAIYEKNKEKYKTSEDEKFKKSIEDYKNAFTNIINLKENKINFFEINNVKEILNVINEQNNNILDEIDFIADEFKDLDKENYIKNELLNDLINYSKKDKTSKLLQGIINFIEAYKKIVNIEDTEFVKEIENLYSKIK